MHMEPVFDFLGILQILAGAYLLYQAIKWLVYAQRRAATDPGFFSPRTAVICPCKGVEPGLERNLSALCEFDYQNYEIFFVLASESDPATSIVKRVASQSRRKTHVVFAGAPQNCSEQINNRRAVRRRCPEECQTTGTAESER